MNSCHHPLPCGTVYLLRHGDCRQDEIKRLIGQTDVPLNPNGRAQASRWQRELADIRFTRVFSSDLDRSVETALIVAGTSAPVRALPLLREINLGTWDGLSVDEVRRLYPAEYEKRGGDPVSYRTPGGESFADLAARVVPLFEEIAGSTTGNVLVVGHAGVNRVILCHLLGMPLADLFLIRQDYCCLNLIECGDSGVRVRGMNLAGLAGAEDGALR